MWEDILKMMLPRQFMEKISEIVDGGEVEGGNTKLTRIGEGIKGKLNMSLTDSQGKKYELRQLGAGEYTFIYDWEDERETIIGYNLTKMLAQFERTFTTDNNIENMGPLAAFLGGSAIQAGKTIMED